MLKFLYAEIFKFDILSVRIYIARRVWDWVKLGITSKQNTKLNVDLVEALLYLWNMMVNGTLVFWHGEYEVVLSGGTEDRYR